jgi:hypothetical protein
VSDLSDFKRLVHEPAMAASRTTGNRLNRAQRAIVRATKGLRSLAKPDLYDDGGPCFCDRHAEYEPHSSTCLHTRGVLARLGGDT